MNTTTKAWADLDAGGNPAIVYRDVHAGGMQADDNMRSDLELAWQSGGWQAIPVDIGRGAGKYNAMTFDDQGRVKTYGVPNAELSDIIDAGIAFRTSGCPGKFQEDISACDRPYGDSPPSDIASYPFQPKKKDMKKIRKQLDIPVRVE